MKFPESLQLLADTLWQCETKEDLEALIEDLSTPWEIVELADRIEILRMLSKGMTQRDIAEELGVSVTTVSRWSRVLQYGRGVAEKYIK
jgi:TrpR-related protein YerC/YecD